MLRWGPQSFTPRPGFAFPPPENLEYLYMPRPMSYEPPIPKQTFTDIFYSCRGPRSHVLPFHFACQPLNIAESLMNRLPQRVREVGTSHEEGEFWGLAAKERRSAFRMLVYLAVCISPTLAFMFAWLFGWFNDGDIQNASTPMIITLASMTLLWAVIYDGNSND